MTAIPFWVVRCTWAIYPLSIGPLNATVVRFKRWALKHFRAPLRGWTYPYINATSPSRITHPTTPFTEIIDKLPFHLSAIDNPFWRIVPACLSRLVSIPLSLQHHICQPGSCAMLPVALLQFRFIWLLRMAWPGSRSRCASCSSFNPQRKSRTSLLDPETLWVLLVVARLSKSFHNSTPYAVEKGALGYCQRSGEWALKRGGSS